jgi:hypothetical protein
MSGSIISTANHPKALWPGIKKWFSLQYESHPLEYVNLFDKCTSDKSYEERVQSIGFGLAQVKSQGASVRYDADQEGYLRRTPNVTMALGYIVTMEELADNQYAELARSRAAKLARSMRVTKETLGAQIYDAAFTTFLGGDGVAFLSGSHPTPSGNQSNVLATPADLSEASLEDLLIQIGDAKDPRGLRIGLRGQRLVIANGNQFVAERIMKSNLQNDTANNAINAIRSMGLLPQGYSVNHYLEEKDQFYIRTDVPTETGLIYQERMALAFTRDKDFDTENAKAKAVERYKFDGVDWRSLFGSAGSGA